MPSLQVTVAGVPVPFRSPVVIGLVGLHIVLGLTSVVTGVVAMLSTKAPGRHPAFGSAYYWCLAAVFATATILSTMRWSEDWYLFVLGALAFFAATIGRAARRGAWHHWPAIHVSGMGGSYILMLTAFYVDNGKNLPIWRYLPTLAYWLVPSAFGLPLIAWALIRHPVVRSSRIAVRTPD